MRSRQCIPFLIKSYRCHLVKQYIVSRTMAKRYLISILALFVVWLAGPHSTCCCLAAATVSAPVGSSSHSCCSPSDTAIATQSCPHMSSVETGLSEERACCKAQATVLAACAQGTFERCELLQVLATAQPLRSSRSTISSLHSRHRWKNRAPPPNVGMGSSRTYLFKRTLLI